MRPTSIVIAATMAVLTSACVHTTETSLAPNVVRLDTRAQGALFTAQTKAQTMRKAAEATLRNGYTHFSLSDGSSRDGVFAGGTMATPVAFPTSSVGVTVHMFRADEPGARNAFKAEDVLRQHAG